MCLYLRNLQVFVKVEGATDGSKPLPGFVPKTLEFVAGDGFVCDALECAVGISSRMVHGCWCL